MELPGKTIDALCGIITGDIDEDYPYRTGSNLINFFSRYGYEESYGSHFPSRTRYTEEKLKELNGGTLAPNPTTQHAVALNLIQSPSIRLMIALTYVR